MPQTEDMRSRDAFETLFLVTGVFHHGFLHFGQTVGSPVLPRGTHWCSHRQQLNPRIIVLCGGNLLLTMVKILYYKT